MSFWALVIQSHVLEFWKGSSQLLQVNVSGFQLLLRKCFGSSRVHGPRFQFQMHLRSEAAAASLLLEHWGLWGWCAATKMEKENALPHYECHQFIVTWNCLDPFFPLSLSLSAFVWQVISRWSLGQTCKQATDEKKSGIAWSKEERNQGQTTHLLNIFPAGRISHPVAKTGTSARKNGTPCPNASKADSLAKNIGTHESRA